MKIDELIVAEDIAGPGVCFPLPIDWSADFQIGAWEKPGMIAPIWKSALRGAFRAEENCPRGRSSNSSERPFFCS
jgi:hypothetical protein